MPKCDICGKEFQGYGNNPAPLEGKVCCDNCNKTYVIPARLKQLEVNKKLKDEDAGEDTPKDFDIRGKIGFLVKDEVEAIDGYDCVLQSGYLSDEDVKVLEEIRNDELDHVDKLNGIYKKLVRGEIEESNPLSQISDDSGLEKSFAGGYDPATINTGLSEEMNPELNDGLFDVVKSIGNSIGRLSHIANDSNNLVESAEAVATFDEGESGEISEKGNEEQMKLKDNKISISGAGGYAEECGGRLVGTTGGGAGIKFKFDTSEGMLKFERKLRRIEPYINMKEFFDNVLIVHSSHFNLHDESFKDKTPITKDDIYDALERVYKGSELGTLSVSNIMTTVMRVTGETPSRRLAEEVYKEIQNSILDDAVNLEDKMTVDRMVQIITPIVRDFAKKKGVEDYWAIHKDGKNVSVGIELGYDDLDKLCDLLNAKLRGITESYFEPADGGLIETTIFDSSMKDGWEGKKVNTDMGSGIVVETGVRNGKRYWKVKLNGLDSFITTNEIEFNGFKYRDDNNSFAEIRKLKEELNKIEKFEKDVENGRKQFNNQAEKMKFVQNKLNIVNKLEKLYSNADEEFLKRNKNYSIGFNDDEQDVQETLEENEISNSITDAEKYTLFGDVFEPSSDGLTVNGKFFSKEKMEELYNKYKSVNIMNRPSAILFYQAYFKKTYPMSNFRKLGDDVQNVQNSLEENEINKSIDDADTVNDIGSYCIGSKYRWEEKYGPAQLTLQEICDFEGTIKLSLDNGNMFIQLPREKFEKMLRDGTLNNIDTENIEQYGQIKTKDSSIKGYKDAIFKKGDTYTNKNGVKFIVLETNKDIYGNEYVTYKLGNSIKNYPVDGIANMLKANGYVKDECPEDIEQEKKFNIKVGDKKFVVYAKDSKEAVSKLKNKLK